MYDIIEALTKEVNQSLWNAFYTNEWSKFIETVITKMKTISDLMEEDQEWWEDYNEPAK